MTMDKLMLTDNEVIGQFHPHGNRPLMAMIEVTNRCDMACPICYSDAGPGAQDVPMHRIRDYLVQLLEVTRSPIPIQISGGEPTLRDDLPAVVSMAKEVGYSNIELITNGLRIHRDPGLLEALKASGLSSVYLQFDGLTARTTTQIRGRDMSRIRLQAVEAIGRSGLCCVLAVVVTRGVNEKEIGPIVRYALEHIDVVRAINFQSATRFKGRFEMEVGGYAMAELLGVIEAEAGVPAETFYSTAIGHPECNAMSPVFIVNGELKPLFAYISEEDLASFLGTDTREKILSLFSGKKSFYTKYLKDRRMWGMLAKAAPIFGANPYNWVRTQHLLLFAKSFMDAGCRQRNRLDQCCFALTGDAGVVSFCAYNNHHRFN